jgi:CDGSH-type Zn-finger protein
MTGRGHMPAKTSKRPRRIVNWGSQELTRHKHTVGHDQHSICRCIGLKLPAYIDGNHHTRDDDCSQMVNYADPRYIRAQEQQFVQIHSYEDRCCDRYDIPHGKS